MNKVVQLVNQQQQATIVNVQCAPRGKVRPLRKKCKKCVKSPHKPVIHEELCGKIFQKSGYPPKTYCRASGIRPIAAIRVENKSDGEMEAITSVGSKGRIKQHIGAYQEVSLLVPRFKSLKIRCEGGKSKVCCGRYEVRMRYTL